MTGQPGPTGDQEQTKPQDTVMVQNEIQDGAIEIIEDIIPPAIKSFGKAEKEPVKQQDDNQNDSTDNADRLSVTDLINLDNISAHNLYLGSELKRIGSSAAIDSDAGSGLLATDDEGGEDMDSSFISSAASSTVGGQVQIDYSALDRFGFIVLGEEDTVGRGGSSEEDKRIRKKQ